MVMKLVLGLLMVLCLASPVSACTAFVLWVVGGTGLAIGDEGTTGMGTDAGSGTGGGKP